MSSDNTSYTEALRALHNLHIALDRSLSLPVGSKGFPARVDPTTHIAEKLEQLEHEIVIAVNSSCID